MSESRLEMHVAALQKFYGPLPAPPRDPFTLFVWEVLSVHTTPRKRDAAFAALKRIRALTPDAMWRAPQKKLEAAVALAGPYTEQRLHALRRASIASGAPAICQRFAVRWRRAARAEGPAADAARAAPTACCCSPPITLCCRSIAGQPRGPAPRLRRRRAIHDVGARKRATPGHRPGTAGDVDASAARFSICPTTAPRPARKPTRTAASARCSASARHFRILSFRVQHSAKRPGGAAS